MGHRVFHECEAEASSEELRRAWASNQPPHTSLMIDSGLSKYRAVIEPRTHALLKESVKASQAKSSSAAARMPLLDKAAGRARKRETLGE